MVRSFFISAAFAVAACQAGPPRDCEVAGKQGLECIERYRGKSDSKMLLGCFPFSKPERIAGAWAHGFETNEFYEGQRASASLVNKGVGETQLQIEGVQSGGPAVRVYQIEVIGRRSRCDMGFPHHIIVVEKVVSKFEAARRPHYALP